MEILKKKSLDHTDPLTDVGMNSMNTPYIYKVSLFSTMKTFDPAPDKDNFCQHIIVYCTLIF